MKKEEIHLGDLRRWLFGQMPPGFLIEVAVRTLLIYLFLLLVMRLFGKRMAGQITVVELAVMITLGAIVAPVMQLPDRGIVFGCIALTVALIFQRGVNLWAFRNEKIDHITVGTMSLLVKDGALMLEELDKVRITKQQLFALLRENKIQNLGKIKRAYLEGCGHLSVYEAKETFGLPIFPPSDSVMINMQQPSPDHIMACFNCGHVQKTSVAVNDECQVCNAHDWGKAYLQND